MGGKSPPRCAMHAVYRRPLGYRFLPHSFYVHLAYIKTCQTFCSSSQVTADFLSYGSACTVSPPPAGQPYLGHGRPAGVQWSSAQVLSIQGQPAILWLTPTLLWGGGGRNWLCPGHCRKWTTWPIPFPVFDRPAISSGHMLCQTISDTHGNRRFLPWPWGYPPPMV